MGLSKKGINQLADDLVRNKKRYNQNRFGIIRTKSKGFDKEECGTFCCLAGFCYLAKLGSLRLFQKEVKLGIEKFENNCKRAGRRQLGLSKDADKFPQIFLSLSEWPDDLQDEYESNGPEHRVITALKALQRLRPDGTIDRDPAAVHTKLPQLEKLLEKVA